MVLQEKTKAVRTYAVSLLLEHGFKASDLVEFAARSQRKKSTYVSDRGSSASPEPHSSDEEDGAPASPPSKRETPRKLSLDSGEAGSGVLM